LTEKYSAEYGMVYHHRAARTVQVVALSHFSVKEYIVSERLRNSTLSTFYISELLAHQYLTECCLRYLLDLNLREMNTEFREHYASIPLYQYSARFWAEHWKSSGMKSNGTRNELVYALFNPSNLSGYVNWLNSYNPDDDAFGATSKPMYRQVHLSPNAFPQPLYFAACLGDLDLVQWLVEQGNDIHAIEGHFGSGFAAAAFSDYTDIVKYFLNTGADPNLRVPTFGSVLQTAAAGGSLQTVEMLLNAGSDVNMEGGLYNSALVAAASREHHSIVSLLLKRGADITLGSRTQGSSIYQAAVAGDLKSVTILLAAGADVNDVSSQDGTPLHGAAKSGKAALVQLLLKRGADVNKGTSRGRGYPLIVAAEEGNTQIVRMLLNAGADPNLVNGNYGKTALEAAINSRNMPTFRAVLEGGADPNALFDSYVNGFQCALWTGETAMAKILLEGGAEFEDKAFVESVNRYDQAPWFFNRLLERSPDIDAHIGKEGSALHVALREAADDAVWILLDKNPNINAVSENGTPLALAAGKGKANIVEELIKRGADSKRSVNWDSPLSQACYSGNKDIVAMLINAGVDVNWGGGAAVNNACLKKDTEMIRFLVEEHGADLNLVPIKYPECTPIQHAANEGDLTMVKFLLDLGADINGPSGKYGTTLHYALDSWKGTLEVVEFLLDNGAKLNDTIENQSLLEKASDPKFKRLVPQLIEAGANVGQKNSNGDTALNLAWMANDQELVDILLANGANFLDGGVNLMLEAVNSKPIEDLTALLECGLDPNSSTEHYTAIGVSKTKLLGKLKSLR
jgi:ankyrin repeat protein